MQRDARHMRRFRAGIAVYSVVLVLGVYPYSSLPAVDIKILVTHLAAFTFLAVYAFLAWRGQIPPACPRLFIGPVAAFIAVNAISGIASPYPANALVMTARYFSCGVLYLAAAVSFRTVRQASKLLLAIVLAAAVSSLYGFCQRAGLDPLPWNVSLTSGEHLRHMASTYGNPNLAGHVLVIALLFSVYLIARRPTRWVIAAFPVLVAHLAFTGLRAGWVALGIAIVFCVAGWRTRIRLHDAAHGARAAIVRFAVTIGVLGALGILAIGIPNGFRIPVDGSLLLRYNSFYSGACMVEDRPFLGFGPDNYRILNAAYWTPYEQEHFARDRALNEHPHNEFLFATISAGIPGLVLYVAILVRAFVAGLAMYLSNGDRDFRRFGLACSAFAVVFAVIGMFGFNFVAPVSGACFFLILGALDGVHSASAPGRTSRRWPYWVAISGCAAVAAVCAAIGVTAFASRVYLARGNSAMYWKNYNAAADQFNRAAVLAPWDWMPAYYAAQAHAASGDSAGALRLLTSSLHKNPRYIASLLDAAFMEFNLAMSEPPNASPDVLEAARAYARQVQALCPGVPEADDVLGRAALLEADRLRADGQQESADYTRLVRDAVAHFTRAVIDGAKNADELTRLTAQAEAMLAAVRR